MRTGHAGVVLAVLAAATPLTASSASAATASWHSIWAPGAKTGAVMDDAAASSYYNIWATGYQSNGTTPIYDRFDGHHWTTVKGPAIKATADQVSTSWKGNVWFDQSQAVGSHEYLSRWSNGKWTSITVKGYTVSTILAVGGDQAWLAGDDGKNGFLSRFDGTHWHKVATLPKHYQVESLGGTSANDVWALGSTNPETSVGGHGQPMAYHWNGKKLTKVTVPTVTLPTPDNDAASFDAIAADSAGNIWASVWIDTMQPEAAPAGRLPRAGSLLAKLRTRPMAASSQTQYMYHWNGTSWSKVAAPTGSYQYLASDGSTGAATTTMEGSEGWAGHVWHRGSTGATWAKNHALPAPSGQHPYAWQLVSIPGTHNGVVVGDDAKSLYGEAWSPMIIAGPLT